MIYTDEIEFPEMFHVKHLSGNFVSRKESTRFSIYKNIKIQ